MLNRILHTRAARLATVGLIAGAVVAVVAFPAVGLGGLIVNRVNGQDEPLNARTLAALLDEKAVDTAQKGIAVALNGAVVPRAGWPSTSLKAGDSVEIVRARQGG